MNLYKRLKPEYREMLKEAQKKYPNSVDMMLEDLEYTHFYTDLRYSTVCMMVNYFDLKEYNPSTIDNLFNNENIIS